LCACRGSLLALLMAATPPAPAAAASFSLFTRLMCQRLRLCRGGSGAALERAAFLLGLLTLLLLLRTFLAAGFVLAPLFGTLLMTPAVALPLRLLSMEALPLPGGLFEASRLAVAAAAFPVTAFVPSATGAAIRPRRGCLGDPLRRRS